MWRRWWRAVPCVVAGRPSRLCHRSPVLAKDIALQRVRELRVKPLELGQYLTVRQGAQQRRQLQRHR
jgi:hypothetical protein